MYPVSLCIVHFLLLPSNFIKNSTWLTIARCSLLDICLILSCIDLDRFVRFTSQGIGFLFWTELSFCTGASKHKTASIPTKILSKTTIDFFSDNLRRTSRLNILTQRDGATNYLILLCYCDLYIYTLHIIYCFVHTYKLYFKYIKVISNVDLPEVS